MRRRGLPSGCCLLELDGVGTEDKRGQDVPARDEAAMMEARKRTESENCILIGFDL